MIVTGCSLFTSVFAYVDFPLPDAPAKMYAVFLLMIFLPFQQFMPNYEIERLYLANAFVTPLIRMYRDQVLS